MNLDTGSGIGQTHPLTSVQDIQDGVQSVYEVKIKSHSAKARSQVVICSNKPLSYVQTALECIGEGCHYSAPAPSPRTWFPWQFSTAEIDTYFILKHVISVQIIRNSDTCLFRKKIPDR